MTIPGDNGVGLVYLDWVLWLGALLAFVLHLAALRSPDVLDSRLIVSSRHMKIVGWGIAFVRWSYVLATSGDLLIPVYTVLAFVLLAWADVFGLVSRLWEKHPPAWLRAMVSEPVPLDSRPSS